MNTTNVFAKGSFEDQVISLLSQLKGTNDTTSIVAEHVPVEQTEAKKQRYIDANSSVWQETGLKYKQWREVQCISKAKVAQYIGVAPSTLTKFEDGQPCTLAKPIEAGYKMLIELRSLSNHLKLLRIKLNEVMN